MKSILQVNLDEIGDTLTFQVTDFPQLKREKKAWHSSPFRIGDKVRVHLAVYPSEVGRGQGSHVSVSLILTEVVKKEDYMELQCNVSVAAIGQHRSAMHKTLELYSCKKELFMFCLLPLPLTWGGAAIRGAVRRDSRG